jgi:xanthine/uracil permease
MWDDISATTLIGLAVAAVLVAILLAYLRQSRTRTILIVVWTALPFLVALGANIATVVDTQSFDSPGFFGFTAVFTLLLLPPWAMLTLLPFNLVRRWREIRAGIDYRNVR